jgi:hypothetical protein
MELFMNGNSSGARIVGAAMTILRQSLFVVAALVLVAGCAGGAGASAPPAPTDGRPVMTEDQAVAAVIANEPRLAGIARRDPEMIGQSSWYEVVPASGVGAFIVTVRIGWGDCQAGCIDEHTWVYAVLPDGTVNLQSDGGGQVPDTAWPAPGADGQEGRTGVHVTALAGPVCPVETVPPDPACEPKPVPNVRIAILDANGGDHGGVLDATGQLFVELEPGAYAVNAEGVPGFMNGPEAQRAVVKDGLVTEVSLVYDTGIR